MSRLLSLCPPLLSRATCEVQFLASVESDSAMIQNVQLTPPSFENQNFIFSSVVVALVYSAELLEKDSQGMLRPVLVVYLGFSGRFS